MKRLINNIMNKYSRISLLITLLLSSVFSFAQDKKVDINVNTKSDGGDGFMSQPWVWIVGGAVFLLLLVALLRNNNSRA